MKVTGSRTTENSITFFTSLPYAAIHNDGGEIVVTKRMKRFFWHKYYAVSYTHLRNVYVGLICSYI